MSSSFSKCYNPSQTILNATLLFFYFARNVNDHALIERLHEIFFFLKLIRHSADN